jgi:hypothetical protein
MAEEIHLGPPIQGSAKADAKAENAVFDLELLGTPSEAWRTEFMLKLAGKQRATFERRSAGRPAMVLRVTCSGADDVRGSLPVLNRAVTEANAEMLLREDKRTTDRNQQEAKRVELERAINDELTKLA